MASRTVVFIPSEGTNIIQSNQVFPGTFVQPPGAEVQYVQYGGQQPGISHNAPQQIPRTNTLEKLLNVETKTLGVIQIMIGLIHIGFGTIACFLFPADYIPVAELGAYDLWGGLFPQGVIQPFCSVLNHPKLHNKPCVFLISWLYGFYGNLEIRGQKTCALHRQQFIVSGSLCVASVKNLNRSLVKCSVGMNITSAVMASIGIILLIAELAVNSYHRTDYVVQLRQFVGIGITVLLLLFSVLQFCITVSAAHFGCQAACCNSDPDSMVFVPYQVSGSMEVSAESNLPAPPEYNSVDSTSKAD